MISLRMCRHVHEADSDVTGRSGDNSQQDVGETRTAQSALQGNVHVPGPGNPTARSDADGFRIL